jgi:hypothetical protein
MSGPCRNRSVGKPAVGKYRSLNILWGREKIKFDHLGKTKDLAATSTEPKSRDIAFLKPNRNPGPPPLARPKGRIDDLSQFNSSARIRLAGGGPAIGKTALRTGFAFRSGRQRAGH